MNESVKVILHILSKEIFLSLQECDHTELAILTLSDVHCLFLYNQPRNKFKQSENYLYRI